ncbi:hypothetical protein [Aquimarina sp. I32.4]|uniref:hypothetical protein n=1 Tax=Aquimarina sp. I32.4 TaxID=2053903 RepID=UPI000CDEC599|nr:hypothetical protein [Aquimarina sp. I32.4]
MTVLSKTSNNLLAFGVPLLLFLSMILITKSEVFETNTNMLSIGITADLLFTIPIIYFLLIKKINVPRTTTVPLFVLGLFIAFYIIPKEHQALLHWVKNWIFPFVELGVIIFILYKARKVIQRFKTNAKYEVDFFSVLKDTSLEILPKKIAVFLAMELAVIYYGFIFWKKRDLTDNEYTYHKNSGTISLLLAFILVIGIETSVIHILLSKWNITVAWVASSLSIYSGIQIFGFLKSILKRPFVIDGDKLHLRYGILSETTVYINDIESIEVTTKLITDPSIKKLSPLGELESHNMILSLKEENTLIGLYGTQKRYKKIAFFVDDKDRFKTEIDTALQSAI